MNVMKIRILKKMNIIDLIMWINVKGLHRALDEYLACIY